MRRFVRVATVGFGRLKTSLSRSAHLQLLSARQLNARPVALQAVTGLLAIMLILVPPGGTVCWPLPNGWHIHIGWTDASGQPASSVQVYLHHGNKPVINLHPSGITPTVPADVLNLSDLRPLGQGALWLLPLLSLWWLCLAHSLFRRPAALAPLEHPPKHLAAV